MYEHGFSVEHALQHGPRPERRMDTQGHATLAIGVGGTDDSDGETDGTVLFHQQLLAGYLIARVLPVGIGQRGAFGDDVGSSRLVVGRG